MRNVNLKLCSLAVCLITVGCGTQGHHTPREDTKVTAAPSVTPFVLSPSGVGEMKLGAFTTWDTVPGSRVYYGSDGDGEFFAGERIMTYTKSCRVDGDFGFESCDFRANYPAHPAVNLLEGPHKDFFTDDNGGILSVNYEVKVEVEGVVGGLSLYAPITINSKSEIIGETQVGGGFDKWRGWQGEIPLNTKFVIQTNTPNVPNGKRQGVEAILGAIVSWSDGADGLVRIKVYSVKIYAAR